MASADPVQWWPMAVIAGALGLVIVAELLAPDRVSARRRWPLNFALGLGNALLVRLLAIGAPAGAALWAAQHGIGVFNLVALPTALVMILAIICMDLALYWQHRMLHRWSWGWALHRFHHADTAMDVSTAVRFHPGEALLSMAYKSTLTILLGLPLVAVLAFEAWLAVGSILEHANLRLSARFDAKLRRFWVTPAMHRVHHSAHGSDHDHNFGFALSVWDQLFGTYRKQESGPHIGLPQPAPAG
jgi:sterol desaturase/sphingolipid hydroxylase (fatty acid hydroxylase superfamily)